MAIEKHICSQIGGDLLTEIKEWLEENATDYFYDYEIDMQPTTMYWYLKCYTSSSKVAAFEIYCRNPDVTPTGSQMPIIVRLADNSTISTTAWDVRTDESPRINILYKTSHGIFMMYNDSSDFNFLITKTSKGNIGIVMIHHSDSTKYTAKTLIPENSTATRAIIDGLEWNAFKNALATPAGISSPATLCFSTDEYAPGVYRMAFFEYSGIVCKFEFNDERYVSNGFFALKE